MIGFDPSLAGGALLPDFLGMPIEVIPCLPKDTAYLLPATGDIRARFISDAHFDWPWQIFLWNQKDLARRHLARIVREAEERLGLPPEPDFRGYILQDKIDITVSRLSDWAERWMSPIMPPSGKHVVITSV